MLVRFNALTGKMLNVIRGWWTYLFFRLKTTSWVGFVLSELKLVSHWEAKLLILVKSSLKWSLKEPRQWQLKIKNCHQQKWFWLECKFTVKSLIHRKKSSGPSMENWGTTALMSTHEKCSSFKTTLCFLLFRKSVKESTTSQ